MSKRSVMVAKNAETEAVTRVGSLQYRPGSEQTLNSAAAHILSLQRTAGNQAVESLFRVGAIQAKLEVGRPNDNYEQEADQVANQVMRMSETAVQESPISVTPLIQRDVDDDEDGVVQAKHACGEVPQVTSGMEAAINSLKYGGEPLDEEARAFFEPRFQRDFSGVRIHIDANAACSAQSVKAKAFTHGNDIVFGSGYYAPATDQGKNLLAHEMAHVIQQKGNNQALQRTPLDENLESSNLPEEIKDALKLSSYPDNVLNECLDAPQKCMEVQDLCKKEFPRDEMINAQIRKAKRAYTAFSKPAVDNVEHWLSGTGKEKIISYELFRKNPAVIKSLKTEYRNKFVEGVKKRLLNGTIKPGAVSQEIPYVSSIAAYGGLKDDLTFSVGGFTLRANVWVIVTKTGLNRYHGEFVRWENQVFDCYNWDPGKSVGKKVGLKGMGKQMADFIFSLPEDKEMCCVENAGKAKRFLIRTEAWDEKNPEVVKGFDFTLEFQETSPLDGGYSDKEK